MILLLALAVAASERATVPAFSGRGDGTLVVLEAPENVSLDFYVVQCARAEEGEAAIFDVFRSGEKAQPERALAGEVYREATSKVSFRIEEGGAPFAIGDRFSFVTFEDVSKIDALLERWVEQYVKWIISREEKERYAVLEGPLEKLSFIESFWKRRDPTPPTRENEAREEHARRFAYAVQTFGAGTPGWATDRGKVYILLGAPSTIDRNPAGRTAFERPSEVWTYNSAPNPKLPASMDVAFVDFTATGRYEIVSSSNLDILAPLRTNIGYAMSELEGIGLLRSGGSLMDQTTGLRYDVDPTRMATEQFDFQRELLEIRKVPQLSLPGLRAVTEASARFPTIPVKAEASVFHAGADSAVVPVTVSIPYARLTPEETGESYRFEVDVVVSVQGAGSPGSIEDRIEVTVSRDELEAYRGSELLYNASLLLPAGDYELLATIRDNPSGAVGQFTSRFSIPRLEPRALTLSSLLLASAAVEASSVPDGGSVPFQFGDVRLIPNLSKSFPKGGSLTAYVEAYGLGGEAPLRVDFFLLKSGRLFSKVAPSYHRPGPGAEVGIRSEISLRELVPGHYALRARITDEISGRVAERESSFTVRPR